MPPYTTQFGLTQDLANYLNRGLPSITGIFPTSTTTTTSNQGAKAAEAATAPLIAAAMQASNRGDGGFNPYNPDMNKVRTDYSPYAYRQAAERNLIGDFYSSGTEAQKLMDMYPEYYEGPKSNLSGLLNFIPGIGGLKRGAEFIGGILDPYLPVNQRAIMENEARGMGILTDDIGRIVQGSGDYNTGANVMAGYNLSQVTPETIQKRRDMINEKMKDPEQKAARLKALDEFEEMMFGPVGLTSRTDAITLDKNRQKDLNKGIDTIKNQDILSGLSDVDFGGIMGVDTSENKDEDDVTIFKGPEYLNYGKYTQPSNIFTAARDPNPVFTNPRISPAKARMINQAADRDRGVDVTTSSKIQKTTGGLGSIGSGGGGGNYSPPSRTQNEARTSSRVSGGRTRAYGL